MTKYLKEFVAREVLEWLRTAYPDTYQYVEQHKDDPPIVGAIDWVALKEKLEARLKEV